MGRGERECFLDVKTKEGVTIYIYDDGQGHVRSGNKDWQHSLPLEKSVAWLHKNLKVGDKIKIPGSGAKDEVVEITRHFTEAEYMKLSRLEKEEEKRMNKIAGYCVGTVVGIGAGIWAESIPVMAGTIVAGGELARVGFNKMKDWYYSDELKEHFKGATKEKLSQILDVFKKHKIDKNTHHACEATKADFK